MSSLAPSRLSVSRGSRQPGCCSSLPERCSPGLVRPSSGCECCAGSAPWPSALVSALAQHRRSSLGVAAGFVLAFARCDGARTDARDRARSPARRFARVSGRRRSRGPWSSGGVAMTLSARSVDSRPRHHWLRWVPWELAVVALAIASYRRLDRAGGVRLVGSQAQGGDLLAQAFPLLALGAVLVVLARPLRWLLRRSRARGGGLAVPLLIGVPSPLRRRGCDRARRARRWPCDRIGRDVDHAHRQRHRDAA